MIKRYFSIVAGSGFASAITFASYPVLAMLYDLEQFSVFGVANALAVIISSFLALRFDYFVLSENTLNGKRQMLVAAIQSALLISIPMFFIAFATALMADGGVWLAIAIALWSVLLSIFNSFLLYCVSVGKIAICNNLRLLRSVSIVGMQLVFGVMVVDGGLVYGSVLALLFTVAFFLAYWQKSLMLSKAKSLLFFLRYKKVLINKRQHIVHQMPQVMINSAVNNSMVLMLAIFFGEVVSGAYVILDKIFRMPVGLVIDAIRPVLIADFRQVGGRGLEWWFFLSLAVSAIYMGAIFIVAAMDLSCVLSGWVGMVAYLPYVGFYAVAGVVSVPVFAIMQARMVSQYLFLFEFLRAFFILILFLFGAYGSLRVESYFLAYSLVYVSPVFLFFVFRRFIFRV